jgi:general L-amino acid transport system permease protein
VGVSGGWSQPSVNGFLLEGGAALTPEFLALWLGLSLFTGAAIAELVRAGALAVPAGQWNAALALGLTRGQAMATVIFPQALRLAIPPLASQYMNLIKNSSLAVVIGYPDLVSIGNTSINQNGQALEVIVIIMAVYLSLNLVVAVVMNAINARVTRGPR